MKLDAHQTAGAAAHAAGENTAIEGVHRGDADRKAKAGSPTHDRLEISGLVSDITRAEAAGSARRAEFVKGLAKLHRTGAYAPDSAALSRKLIEQALSGPEGGNERG
jgi:hypothetical protein